MEALRGVDPDKTAKGMIYDQVAALTGLDRSVFKATAKAVIDEHMATWTGKVPQQRTSHATLPHQSGVCHKTQQATRMTCWSTCKQDSRCSSTRGLPAPQLRPWQLSVTGSATLLACLPTHQPACVHVGLFV